MRFNKYKDLIDSSETIRTVGEIFRVQGMLIESRGPHCKVGDLCKIKTDRAKEILAEVIGFNGQAVQMMPLSSADDITPGCKAVTFGKSLEIIAGEELLGRVIDGTGCPIDGAPLKFFNAKVSIFSSPPDVLKRKQITEPLDTGVRAIDSVLTVGKGQRIGIFSGTGVGKSTLLSMIARNTSADVNVLCLIGERRREVLEFIERDLGEEGMRRSIIIVSTSDEPPLSRVRSAFTATSIAEYFRDIGKDVLLMVDSLTRMAMAQREIGVTMGEMPVLRGYSPSVFSLLAKVLERAGTNGKGTITAFYNVLVEGGDMDEPIADATRGILDGHIVLAREIAQKGHYPAIDVTQSISRLMPYITAEQQSQAARKMVELCAAYKEAEDLIKIGAYVQGSSPIVDEAIEKMPHINTFLKQGLFETAGRDESVKAMLAIIEDQQSSFFTSDTPTETGALQEALPFNTEAAGE